MNKMKKIYVSPWVKAVSLDTEEDVMLRISASDVDPTDPGFEWGVKEEIDFDEGDLGGGGTPVPDPWGDEW